MPSQSLPARPNLEQLKNQAKDLLKAYRAGHPSAIARFRESMPRLLGPVDDQPDSPSLSLRDAQQVVAVEYGFPSWSHMHTHIQERKDVLMFEMTVEGVRVSHKNQQRVVVLKGKEVNVYLPIWIGPAEGDSIAMKLQGKETARPMTHDLMDSMIADLGGKVMRVVVSDIREETFFGKIVLQRNGTTIERDSRPSDAIALAVRTGASIYAEDVVLDRVGVEFDPETGHPTSTSAVWPTRSIKEMGPEFSEEAKRLLAEAGAHAARIGHAEIEPEDILFAVLDDAEGAGARVLVDLGLDIEAARAKLEQQAARGDSSPDTEPDLSEDSQRVAHAARTEAYIFFHGQVGAEHILLGLVVAEEGLASRILKGGGIEIKAARAAVGKMVDSAE